MKKLITKIQSFTYRLIYGEATAIEALMFGIVLFVILFFILIILKPGIQKY
ncbi:hypothetical protein [Mucilaginibacter sp. L3T2-6]|uniref:hypothetical protein n=1 Tax=Mucilaginibacter sp. L3T2-6 TaxID=3062491 RepID=UPI00267455A5|nr:hypothetical protein [Mucilaginibacter sp. L3T2-6]MDO3641943.1 hypothetical protein [Mucilaginibacter sp. L3T2-6]MDV6214379.1 hypothetical protein [Mucilaginibacter sp. L3T2-6]